MFSAVSTLDSCLTDEEKSAWGVNAKGPEAVADEDNPVLTSQQMKSGNGEQDGKTRWRFNLTRVAAIVAGILFGFLIVSLNGYTIWNLDSSHQDDIDETSLAMTELLID